MCERIDTSVIVPVDAAGFCGNGVGVADGVAAGVGRDACDDGGVDGGDAFA
jgi:hypothetical protein